MNYGSQFVLTLFTNSPSRAAEADGAGVNRIGVDLERWGKEARQGHLNTWISDHQEKDIAALRTVVRRGELFARCNPVHAGSAEEIDRLIAMGVDVLMLPYFTAAGEVERFVRMVDGRAWPVPLLETAAAALRVDDICRVDGVGEIHVGLNDLRLTLGWPTHFHVLVSDLLQQLGDTILAAGKRLGVGGLGRAGDNDLPIPSDLVYAQYPRLKATAALVSRSFFGAPDLRLEIEVPRTRERLEALRRQPPGELARARDALRRCLPGA